MNRIYQAIDHLLQHDWLKLTVPLTALAITMAIGLTVRALLIRALRHREWRIPPGLRDLLARTFRGVSILWILLLGLHLALQVSELPQRYLQLGSKLLVILWVLSLTLVASRLASSLVHYYGQQVGPAGVPITSLTGNLAGLGVGLIGLLILLHRLGLEITPLLTALGVGGLAVALALRDTLSNLFAGFYISLAGQVRPGDYIRLDGGQEGHVSDITWRNTTIQSLGNNMVIVPNAKLAEAIVTNFHLPDKTVSSSISVRVAYDSDPDVVERLLIEEALSAQPELPGMLAQPEPSVRLEAGSSEPSLGFTLNFSVQEFGKQFLVQHELRRRVLKRLRKEGLGAPFPVREIHVRETQAER